MKLISRVYLCFIFVSTSKWNLPSLGALDINSGLVQCMHDNAGGNRYHYRCTDLIVSNPGLNFEVEHVALWQHQNTSCYAATVYSGYNVHPCSMTCTLYNLQQVISCTWRQYSRLYGEFTHASLLVEHLKVAHQNNNNIIKLDIIIVLKSLIAAYIIRSW